MTRKPYLVVLGGCGLLLLAGAMFLIGRASGMAAAASSTPATPSAAFAQSHRTLPDLLPQPGPDQQGQGQGKDCKPLVLFYYQGRLYQMQLGPDNNQQGPSSTPPEYFPIAPYRGPAIPGLPFSTPPGNRQQPPYMPPVGPRF